MIGSESMAVICGLCSALAWGAGDFAGGVASRRGNALTVVFFSQLIGGGLLLALAMLFSQSVPPVRHLFFGGAAGIFGVLGVIGLYKGFAQGRMGLVAPLSAVVSALLPMVFALITEGLPGAFKLVGFGIAVVAVWFLSAPGKNVGIEPGELRLAIFAGLGFGLFFIFIDRASDQSVLWPLVAARGAAILSMAVMMTATRRMTLPPSRQLAVIVAAGILDTAGNAAFGMAAHFGRLDIAAILASLYPASTVLLAWVLLRERLGRQQWVGVAAAGIALVLIAL